MLEHANFLSPSQNISIPGPLRWMRGVARPTKRLPIFKLVEKANTASASKRCGAMGNAGI